MRGNTSYKKTTAEEISSLRVENTSLREEIASLKKMSQESRQLLQEAECAKNKVEEECARYKRDKLLLKLRNAREGLPSELELGIQRSTR